MPARRIPVSDKKVSLEPIRRASANHSPRFIAVDEIGHHGDADAVASTVNRGVGMVATCHGTLANVVNTQTFWPVMGAIREHRMERRRMTEASFDVAAEVRGVGRFIVHERVKRSMKCSQAVNRVAAGSASGRTSAPDDQPQLSSPRAHRSGRSYFQSPPARSVLSGPHGPKSRRPNQATASPAEISPPPPLLKDNPRLCRPGPAVRFINKPG